MLHRSLSAYGPVVSRLSLGSWNTYERMGFDDAVAMVRRALDAGVNFFDVTRYDLDDNSSVPLASPHTESIFSRIIQASGACRHEYALAVKLWYDRPEQPLRDQLDASLQRLGTEYADIIETAHPASHGLSVAEHLDAVAELIRTGRARAWGVGNFDAATLREVCEQAVAAGVPLPVLVQQKYSVARRTVVEDAALQAVHADFGVQIQAADTLEGGVLLGKGTARKIGRDTGGLRERIRALAPILAERAAALGISPAQLAIAFCLRNESVCSVLVGCSSLAQLEDNLGAVEAVAHLGERIDEAVADLGLEGHVVDPL